MDCGRQSGVLDAEDHYMHLQTKDPNKSAEGLMVSKNPPAWMPWSQVGAANLCFGRFVQKLR